MIEMNTMYRVMILYMLDKVEYPLTNTQITNFILEKDYTNYFTVQQTISDLLSSQLITAESTHSNTLYRLTDEGRATLQFFSDKISDAIKSDVLSYFEEHHFDLKQETSIIADYYKASGKGYDVHCRIRDNTRTILDLSVNVSTREQAEIMCANWKEQNLEVYSAVMDALLK